MKKKKSKAAQYAEKNHPGKPIYQAIAKKAHFDGYFLGYQEAAIRFKATIEQLEKQLIRKVKIESHD